MYGDSWSILIWIDEIHRMISTAVANSRIKRIAMIYEDLRFYVNVETKRKGG